MDYNYRQSNRPISKVLGRLLSIIFILVTVFAGVYYRDYLFHSYQTAYSLIAGPCRQTTSYRIESLDSRFGISEEKLRQAIGEAAGSWNKASGRELFQYEEEGDLAINLIYDNRQAAVNEQKDLNNKVEDSESAYNQLKINYDRAVSRYEAEKKEYEASQVEHSAEVQAYEKSVRNLNRRGNVTPEEQAGYNAERDRLNAEAGALNKKAASLKAQVDNINSLVRDLNRLARELDLHIEDFNSIGEELGEFQEGVFRAEGINKEIVIYQFNDYDVLVRVLAHELGHSLNLEHVSDPEAIMYKINQGEDKVLKEADLSELGRVCGL